MAPVVALPTLRSHPQWTPLLGMHGACSLRARPCGPSRTLSPLPPHPAALSSGRGGGAFRPPLPSPPTLGGAKVCGRGGGAPMSPFPRCTHVVGRSLAQRRHVARHLSLRRGGGGLAVWLPLSPFLPCVRTPSGPPVWACTVRVPYGHGRVVRPAPSLRCLPTLPLCPRGGGGAHSAPPLLHPPPLGGRRCVGGGGGRPCRLSLVARKSQAGRKHSAGMRRGTCPSAGRGGGMPCGSRRRPSYPAFAPPVVPPFGLAWCVFPTGTAVWSVPHPLSAASPPAAVSSGRGGGAFRSPLPSPPTLGGAEVCGGGGGAPLSSSLRSTHVAGMTQARRKHEA